ncbi:hypothetical protein Purlil1_13136 [Purpureocillium lilacinum]|uniref:DUF6594 domain-containing protein n=1 Tax=Purpureocillium lilacinum TaxID=33203 RepID=A0ABR0BF43_PURLI|nr:hypothetical protein Purlil1_13136 [Purpureocillium lilacinum]
MDTASEADGTGFPLLAGRMALGPDYETFIFRRYDRLSARNLLHLESRLAYLADKDLLSRFLQDHWMFKTTRVTDETEYVDERHISWIAAGVSTVVATALLLGAIFLLRLLERETAQLGVIAVFTVLFAASVGALTNARRAEIFAAITLHETTEQGETENGPRLPGDEDTRHPFIRWLTDLVGKPKPAEGCALVSTLTVLKIP